MGETGRDDVRQHQTTDQRRRRLGELVRARRGELQMTLEAAAEASELSVPTWRKIETASGDVRPLTMGSIEGILGWPAGSIPRYLADQAGEPRAGAVRTGSANMTWDEVARICRDKRFGANWTVDDLSWQAQVAPSVVQDIELATPVPSEELTRVIKALAGQQKPSDASMPIEPGSIKSQGVSTTPSKPTETDIALRLSSTLQEQLGATDTISARNARSTIDVYRGVASFAQDEAIRLDIGVDEVLRLIEILVPAIRDEIREQNDVTEEPRRWGSFSATWSSRSRAKEGREHDDAERFHDGAEAMMAATRAYEAEQAGDPDAAEKRAEADRLAQAIAEKYGKEGANALAQFTSRYASAHRSAPGRTSQR